MPTAYSYVDLTVIYVCFGPVPYPFDEIIG